MKQENIAQVCHEVNRAYCQALGDNSQPTWEDAPEWQRSSARMGVDLHTMGNFGPEASHISWMAQKVAEGWVYGEVKDPEAKTHPCIVPFDQLPKEQQAKDFIFRAVVHALRQSGSGMTFGLALEAIEAGKRIQRAGWNGRGMCVYLVPANSYPAQTGAAKELYGDGAMVPYNAYMAIKNVDGTVSTWVPSVNDVLAKDWSIV